MDKKIKTKYYFIFVCIFLIGFIIMWYYFGQLRTREVISLRDDASVAAIKVQENMTEGIENEGFTSRENGFLEMVTIRIPVYERGWQGWNTSNSYWTKWIQENFGDRYNIKVEYIPIERSSEVIAFKQLLAAGTAPDIIYHYDYPNILDYYLEGAFQPLDKKEIAYYAPTFWNNMGHIIEEYGVINNKQMVVMGERVELVSKNYVTIIRQDWIDEVGLKMPTSLQEYNELLLAWKDAGLGYETATLLNKSYAFDYGFREWPINSDEIALYSDLAVAGFTWKPTHDFIKNMNVKWNKGLVSKEFYLDKDGSKAKADFISGKAGVWKDYIYSSSISDIESLLMNDPKAKLAVLDPRAMIPEGNLPQGRKYWPFGMIYGINVNTTDEARQAIWMYLEWLSQPEVLYTLQNGFEGIHYIKDERGLPLSEGYSGEERLSNNDNADYWCLITANKVYGNEELNDLAAVNSYGPKDYEYLIEDVMNYNKKYEKYLTSDMAYTVPIESLSEYSGDLSYLFQELYVKLVTCDTELFEEMYEEASLQYLDAGFQAIIDEKTIAIKQKLFH